SWLGIDVQPRFKHSDETRGVVISGVLDNSPASAAGLQAGDLLLRVDGTPIDVRFDEQMTDFMRLVSTLPIGKPVEAVVQRKGKELPVKLVASERGEIFPQQQELKPWGLTARNLSPLVVREMKRNNLDGVLVTSVRPGGPAGNAKPALQPRDVLVEVN